MIRHVAVFTWKPDADPAARQEWRDRLAQLPGQIKELRALSVGPDVRHSRRSWDDAVVADLDSLEALEAYEAHPAHTIATGISGPIVERIATVDFEL